MSEKKKQYEYDIAISLSAVDLEYAQKLKRQLNSNLRVFLYTDNQQQLVSKNGNIEFAEVFREKARIVVILAGRLWGTTFNTELEENAITDRAKEKDTYDFIVVIPLDKGSIPMWYPKSRIYANPHEYSVEQIARFIEFKFADSEGELKEVTLTDRLEEFQSRVEARAAHVRFLESDTSMGFAKEELNSFMKLFNQGLAVIQQHNLEVPIRTKPLNAAVLTFDMAEGHAGISKRLVKVKVQVSHVSTIARSSRAHLLVVEYCEDNRQSDQEVYIPHKTEPLYFNQDSEKLRGWSERLPIRGTLGAERRRLYYQDQSYYDLGPIRTTNEVIKSIHDWLFDGLNAEFEHELK